MCVLPQISRANPLLIEDTDTKLADRTAQVVSASKQEDSPAPEPKSTGRSANKPSSPAPVSIATIREDLVAAQKQRGELQKRLDVATVDLEKLQKKSGSDDRRIDELTLERNAMTKKLRDRDEELRGKTKLLDDIQGEAVTLTLQLNVTEEQNNKLRSENKDLVDRWMARMGQEAEAMNIASKFT